jgi:PhnB protein
MANLSAYLTFNGNCKEAMEFYKSCLGGEFKPMTYGESPMGAQTPAEMRSMIMHSYLKSDGIHFMAADAPEGTVRHGNRVSLCLIGDSAAELKHLFSKLSAGGKVTRPLKEEFFGTYGELTDKYGFTWMFQYSAKQMM